MMSSCTRTRLGLGLWSRTGVRGGWGGLPAGGMSGLLSTFPPAHVGLAFPFGETRLSTPQSPPPQDVQLPSLANLDRTVNDTRQVHDGVVRMQELPAQPETSSSNIILIESQTSSILKEAHSERELSAASYPIESSQKIVSLYTKIVCCSVSSRAHCLLSLPYANLSG